MAQNFPENAYKWSRARSISNGAESISTGSDGVDFTNLPVDEDGCSKLASALNSDSSACRALKFSNSNLDSTSIASLAANLGTNNRIEYLFIDSNNLGYSGAQLISTGLQQNTSLTHLSLSNNLIQDLGAAAIASLLSTNNTLRFLGLAKNGITDLGAASLAESLKINNGLQELILSNNAINTDGDIALANALMINRTLLSVALHQDTISEQGANALLAALKVNKTVTYLGLGIYNSKKRTKRRARRVISSNVKSHARRSSKRRDMFTSSLTEGSRTAQTFAPWRRCKLMVVGEGRSGKTATVRALQGLTFTENLRSTVGANVSHVQTQQRSRNQHKWRLVQNRRGSFLASLAARLSVSQISRENLNSNQKNMSLRRRMSAVSLRKSINRGRRVSSVHSYRSNRSSLNSRRSSVESYRSSVVSDEISISEQSFLPPILSKEEAEKLASEDLFVTAKEEVVDKVVSFTLWDYGGQDVFYPLHHLFLTPLGIYTIVFSLQRYVGNKPKAMEYISFWLNSIKIHAPAAPVFLVGTFLDQIPGNNAKYRVLDKINTDLTQLIATKFPQVVFNGIQDICFYPIDNTDQESIKIFRAAVEKVSRAQEFVKRSVDLRWVGCLENMLDFGITQVSVGNVEHWITLEKAKEIAKELGVVDEEQVFEMLKFFHDHGLLVYLTATLNLQQVITLNPQWLIDKIARVIRDTKLHKYDINSLRVLGLAEDADQLAKEGIVTKDLLDHFWHNSQVDFFLDLMKHTMLLSEYQFSGEKLYLVPSMVAKIAQPTDTWTQQMPRFVIRLDFSIGFLPLGVFERVICLFVDYSRETGAIAPPEVLVGYGRFYLGALGRFIVAKEGDFIEIGARDDQIAAGVFHKTQQIMRKVSSEVFNNRLEFQVILSDKAEESRCSVEEAEKNNLFPWFSERGKVNAAKFSFDIPNFLDF